MVYRFGRPAPHLAVTRCATSTPRRRALPALLAAVLAALFLTTLTVAAPSADAATPSWLSRINAVRADAGLHPVTMDRAGVAGIRAHLAYLTSTVGSLLSGVYASAHTENPRSPMYSKAGAKAAASSDIAWATGSDVDAIDEWLAAPFHAIGMLRPALTQVAFYRDPVSGAAGLDVLSHLGRATGTDMLYPRRQVDVAQAGPEMPDPVETCRTRSPGRDWSHAGFPIIALLPKLASYSGISATLRSPSGALERTSDGSLCIVDAATYRSSNAVYGPAGASILRGDRAVLLISNKPLTRGAWAARLALGSRNHDRVIAWRFTSTAG